MFTDPVDTLVRELNNFFSEKCGVDNAVVQVTVVGPYLIRLNSSSYESLTSTKMLDNLTILDNLNILLDKLGFSHIEFGIRGCYIATRLLAPVSRI